MNATTPLIDRRPAAPMQTPPPEAHVRARQGVEAALRRAHDSGVIVTVELVPQQPLAMGHHAYRIETRPGREGVTPL